MFALKLSRVANFALLTHILNSLNLVSGAGGDIRGIGIVSLSVSFLAGLGSFLSPCILPLVPGFLSYLASTAALESA